jgi:hypothetical protein
MRPAGNVFKRLPLILTTNARKGVSLSEAIAQKTVEIVFFLYLTRIDIFLVEIDPVLGDRITCRGGIVRWNSVRVGRA